MEGKGLSTYDVARRSGNLITHQTVWSLLNAQGKDVKVGTLKALAKGLGVSEDEIFAVARGKSVSGDLQLEESKLLEYFRVLTPESRDVLLAYAEMMSLRTPPAGRRIPATTKGRKVFVADEEEARKRA
ncbi:MAG: Cro/C1-type DNA-binding domain [Acidobacteriota bacterium]|jgi:transcriptional regulator with XRE-family HTH domain|nr:Cro/C1-type DNA-binding domain [Acidobacteriota bacterium]